MRIKTFLASGMVLLLTAASALAQGINPSAGSLSYYNRPTVSPYVNLSIRNQYGLSSYQTLVRPMLEQQAAAERQVTPLGRLQSRAQPIEAAGSRRSSAMRSVPQTGRYMNYSHFYARDAARSR